MIIAKLRKPFLILLSFQPIEDWLWKCTTSVPGYSAPSEYVTLGYDFTDYNTTNIEVGNLYVDSVEYEEEASQAACILNEESWYFDAIAQELYVHPNHSVRLDSSKIDPLKVVGYSSGDVYYDKNGIEYLPYLRSDLTIKKETDRLVYQSMAFVKNTLRFDNKDGEFTQYGDNPTSGADAELLYLSEEDTENPSALPVPVYVGFVDTDALSKTRYSVGVQDKRTQLNVNIPNTVFDSTTYPNIGDNVGITIPDGYGDTHIIPAICTNLDTTSGDVTYKYGTAGTTIGTVSVKIDDVWVTKTPSASSGTSCTFTLTAANGRDASGNPYEARVSGARLRDYDNPADIIADIIYRYADRPYGPTYFNTAMFESEKTDLADVYLYMGEQKPLIDYIEELQSASNYGFRFDIDSNGKYTIKLDRNDRAVSQTISGIDNIDMDVLAERDFTEYATSVKVKYNRDYTDSVPSAYVIDDTYSDDTYQIYRYYKEAVFDSNLTNETDANEKAALIAEDYSVARMRISFETCCILDIELYDIITLDTRTYIDGVVTNDYLGDRTLKIIKIVKYFGEEKTKCVGYDITGV